MRNNLSRKYLLISLFSLYCLALLSPLTPAAIAALRVGDILPKLALTDLKGSSFVIPDALRGKVAVILFWTTGCSSCKEDIPALDTLYREYQRKGLIVVAVNLGESPESVRAALKGLGVSYPVLIDRERRSAASYDVIGVPRVFILDRSGSVRMKIVGSTPRETIKKSVQSLL